MILYFKRLDIVIQIAIPIIAHIHLSLNETLEGFLISVTIFYGGLAIWQLLSTVIHLAIPKLVRLPDNRKVYYILLLIALSICLYPLTNPDSYSLMPIVIVGAAMAVFYFVITVKEYSLLKKAHKTDEKSKQ